MLNIASQRTKQPSVADLLPWAIPTRSGIVQTKKAAFVAGYYARPPDSASSTDEQCLQISDLVNTAMTRLGDGWSVWADVTSIPAADYPPANLSHFPDPISRAIDEERRQQFRKAGAHYENDRAFILCYTPPLQHISKMQALMYEGNSEESRSILSRIEDGFAKTMEKFEDQVGIMIGLRRMQSYRVITNDGREHTQDELVSYLNYCATGRHYPLMLPDHGGYLDAIIGGQEMWPGETPLIGTDYVCTVTIDGFPAEHTPNITAALNTLEMPYRYSQRTIFMDGHTAVKHLNKYRKQWAQKVRGIKNLVLQTQGGAVDAYAMEMQADAEAAMSAAQSGRVAFGYYSPVIVLRHTDPADLREMARLVERTINECGFAARIEGTNTVEAWRGSLPGDIDANVRRPIVHTKALADFLPLSGVWTGFPIAPCPYYPPGAPPLLHARTIGSIPFRLNLHVGDVGHTLLFGPVGMGKSSGLNAIALQARRYAGMKIWSIDYKRGMFVTSLACGGRHYEIGGNETPQLCPLARLENQAELAKAQDWVETCFALQNQNHAPRPEHRIEIRNALVRMAQGHLRSLTDFNMQCQDIEVQSAMRYYTHEGPAGFLFDGKDDAMETNDFTVFETMDLMARGELMSLPALIHISNEFERSLDGTPHILFLDELWTVLGHPVRAHKLYDWLKLLRSLNCAVVMATQSLSDAARSNILDVLTENCPTKIYLSNASAENIDSRAFYERFGLNANQIRIIREARPKRDYYVVSPEGCRLIDLDMGPLLKAIATATSEPDVVLVKKLMSKHGQDWKRAFLDKKGISLDEHPFKDSDNVTRIGSGPGWLHAATYADQPSQRLLG